MFPSWEIVNVRDEEDGAAYLNVVRTRMATAQGVALLIDTGSPENLCGSAWSEEMQEAALAANRSPVQYQHLERPLTFGGIGTGSQTAEQLGIHAIGLPDGADASFQSPILSKSETPALLGPVSYTHPPSPRDS